MDHPSSSFELRNIKPTVDGNNVPERLQFTFAFVTTGVECKLTITLHHTTRKVQVQGNRVMPDGSRVAHWFVKHVMHNKFLDLARENKLKIDQFHAELLRIDSERIVVSSREGADGPACSVCGKVFNGQSKPRPCPSGSCQAMLHSTCLKKPQKHQCAPALESTSLSQPVNSSPSGPESASALKSLLSPLTIVATAPQVSPAVSSSRKRSSADVSFMDTEVAVLPSSLPTTVLETPATSSPPSLSYTTSASHTLPEITFSSQVCSFSSAPSAGSLPPSVRQKVASKPPQKRAKTLASTPDSVQNEFLNNELDIAKAKISSLESAIVDRDNTIKLYGQRLKAMEEVQFSTLSRQYLTPTPPSSQPDSQSTTSPTPSPAPIQCTSTQCPGADSMAAVKVELSQLRDIVVSLQSNVLSLGAKSPSSRAPPPGAARPVARPYLLPTPSPSPWVNGTPPGSGSFQPQPWSGQRSSQSRPHSGPSQQTKTHFSSTHLSRQATYRPATKRPGNTHSQPAPRKQQQPLRQTGGSIGGVRPSLSAAAAAKERWRCEPYIPGRPPCPPTCRLTCCHPRPPPASQIPPTSLGTPQEQHPADPFAANIPVQNRFDALADNLNM